MNNNDIILPLDGSISRLRDQINDIGLQLESSKQSLTSPGIDWQDIQIQKEILFMSYFTDIVNFVKKNNGSALICAITKEPIESPTILYPCLHVFDEVVNEYEVNICPLCRSDFIYRGQRDNRLHPKPHKRSTFAFCRNMKYLNNIPKHPVNSSFTKLLQFIISPYAFLFSCIFKP
jgi:hypothetical protein